MGNKDFRYIRRIMAVLLCALIFVAFMPEAALAFESQTETESAEEIELTEAKPETLVLIDQPDDPDTLLEGYMDKQLREELAPAPPKKLMRKSASAKRREKLNECGQSIYDSILNMATAVASGEEESSTVTVDLSGLFSRYYVQKKVSGITYNVITRQSLGISSGVYVNNTFSEEAKAKLYDFGMTLNALLTDEPYMFYWYDKTLGAKYGIDGMKYDSLGNIYIPADGGTVFSTSLTVAGAYRKGDAEDFTADTKKTGAAAETVNRAAAIIEANSDKPDVQKLNAYKTEICTLTDYNDEAAEDVSHDYGDPWQMIYVFDNDPDTNVVCEGYAKAFQYLCDHTDFADGRITCDTVSGTMKGRNEGLHMWNVLHMDDGENYIADITNSDAGMIGSNGSLFLKAAMEGGSVADGYSYDTSGNGRKNISYIYRDETLKLFTDSELMMAEADYSGPHHLINAVYEWSDDLSLCTATCECSDHSGEELIRKAPVTKAVSVPATCTERGTMAYTAEFRQEELGAQTKEIEEIPKLGHDYIGTITKAAAEGVEGVRTYTCSRCGDSYTEVIPAIVYPEDLPAVKISKPKAGKKKATVRWKKVSKKNQKKINGIEIQVATDRGFTDIVKTANGSKKKTSKVVKGLKKKTKYYVRIRAYKKAADGKHVSAWKVKSVKIK